MELPRDPVILPQARRYSRTFPSLQGKKFSSGNQITIDIPAIDRTYLSKDVKLYFDFNITYQEASDETLTYIFQNLRNGLNIEDSWNNYAYSFFGYENKDSTTQVKNPFYAYTKPYPTFDINGAYSLISRLQVFSYLNNTLLEDIPQHDLLTAEFADFWLSDNRERPYGSYTDEYTQQGLIRKQPCSYIYPLDSSILEEPLATESITISFDSNNNNASVKGKPRTVTMKCQLDLFSFLGRFSDKFCPLHNGFKLVLTLADFKNAVGFNTMYGHNELTYKPAGKIGNSVDSLNLSSYFMNYTSHNFDVTNNKLCIITDTTTYTFEIPVNATTNGTQGAFEVLLDNAIRPYFNAMVSNGDLILSSYHSGPFKIDMNKTTLLEFDNVRRDIYSVRSLNYFRTTSLDSKLLTASVSNVHLKADLLEVTPELDRGIDKMVYSKSYKYQKNFYSYPGFSSSNVVDIVRSPVVNEILPKLKSITKVFVGQRPVRGSNDIGFQKLGYRIKNYISGGRLLYNNTEVCNLSTDEEAWESYQTCSANPLDFYINKTDFTVDEDETIGTGGQQTLIQNNGLMQTCLINSGKEYTVQRWWGGLSSLSTLYQGRYLLAFDARIPGATENAIAGIDSSKAKLEYELKSDSTTCWKVDIDVFVEHDAFIHVDPGKTTSVSF